MRLIDADALCDQCREWDREQRPWMTEGYHTGIKDCMALASAAPTVECAACEHWDGPFGWLDSRARGYGKCCVWTITASPANPGCGETHFRDTPEDGYCYRFQRRQP
jgi:hypothetical protein